MPWATWVTIARCQRRANLGRPPAHAALQKNGYVQPHPILHIGNEKIDRLQCSQAAFFGVGIAGRGRRVSGSGHC